MRGGEYENAYQQNVKKFNNFKAYYFPEKGRNLDFETSTPVNSFRILFNLYFDDDYKKLEDRIYVNSMAERFQFRNITDVLIKADLK